MDEKKGDKYALRSVNRALDVLQVLSEGSSDGMAVGDIALAINVSRSTAFTLLQTLSGRGFVVDRRIGGARLYKLGLALITLGNKAATELTISQLASPVLQALTNETQLTSRLAILDDGYAVTISRNDGPGILQLNAALGSRELPHCSAIGKALLADLSNDTVTDILKRLGMPRRTEHTLTTPSELIKNLELVRTRGYSIDDEEDHLGVVCLGAPVRNNAGAIVAAISVSTLKTGRSTKDINQLGLSVLQFAVLLSEQIG